MHLSSRLYRMFGSRRVLAVLAGVLVISALAASPALAKGPTPKPTGGEQCWVSPNPVVWPQGFTVWGSGFQLGLLLDVYISNGAGIAGYLAGVTSGGWFAVTAPGGFDLGTHDVSVYNAMDRRLTLLCKTTFDVLQ